jgi:hypothetical protein
MINAPQYVALDEQVHGAYAAWASKPRGVPNFIIRRFTGAIIRAQPSLVGVAMALSVVSVVGLVALAVAAARTGF